jgi:hypothetical protein
MIKQKGFSKEIKELHAQSIAALAFVPIKARLPSRCACVYIIMGLLKLTRLTWAEPNCGFIKRWAYCGEMVC